MFTFKKQRLQSQWCKAWQRRTMEAEFLCGLGKGHHYKIEIWLKSQSCKFFGLSLQAVYIAFAILAFCNVKWRLCFLTYPPSWDLLWALRVLTDTRSSLSTLLSSPALKKKGREATQQILTVILCWMLDVQLGRSCSAQRRGHRCFVSSMTCMDASFSQWTYVGIICQRTTGEWTQRL